MDFKTYLHEYYMAFGTTGTVDGYLTYLAWSKSE